MSKNKPNLNLHQKNDIHDYLSTKDIIFTHLTSPHKDNLNSEYGITRKTSLKTFHFKKNPYKHTLFDNKGHILQSKLSPSRKIFREGNFHTKIDFSKTFKESNQKLWPFFQKNETKYSLTSRESNNFIDEIQDQIKDQSLPDISEKNENINNGNDKETKLQALFKLLEEEKCDQEEQKLKNRFKRKAEYNQDEVNNIKVGQLLETNIAHFPIELRRTDAFRVLLTRKSNNRSPQFKTLDTDSTRNLVTSRQMKSIRGFELLSPLSTENQGFFSKTNGFIKKTPSQNQILNTDRGGEIQYYHNAKIGYKNYKYLKVKEDNNFNIHTNRIRKSHSVASIKKKDTLEACIQSLYEQKMYAQANNQLQDPNDQPQENSNQSPELVLNSDAVLNPFENDLLKEKVLESPKENYEVAKVNQIPATNTKYLRQNIHDNRQNLNFNEDSFESDQKLGIGRFELKGDDRIPYVPNLTHIIKNKKSSFKYRQLKQEFIYYMDLTKKHIMSRRNKIASIDSQEYNIIDYKLKQIEKVDGVLYQIFIENNDFFQIQKQFIVERVLLVLEVNLCNKDFELITWDQYLKFKKILIFKDASNIDIINFVIKFFALEKGRPLEKSEFMIILRTLTDKVDQRLLKKGQISINLYDNFIENFKLAGVISNNSNTVDFEKFKHIYESFKMNILDIIDLISGANF